MHVCKGDENWYGWRIIKFENKIEIKIIIYSA